MLALSAVQAVMFSMPAEGKDQKSYIYIDRKNKTMYVIDGGARNTSDVVGIGKGGLRRKRNMGDQVTPTGTFAVDIILSDRRTDNAIDKKYIKRYGTKTASRFLGSEVALSRLFANMNSIDFDGNGKADGAYGSTYVGLSSTNVVTGPKLIKFKKIPYWYSIALHTTPLPKAIGRAQSGGCVHVRAKTLEALVADGTIAIGTKVVIADGPPS